MIILFSSHRLHTVPNRIVSTTRREKPPPHDIATQTLPQHIGAAESGKPVDEEQVVTTVAVASMIQPTKGTVNDTTVSSKLELWTRTSHCTSRSRRSENPHKYQSHARMADTTRKKSVKFFQKPHRLTPNVYPLSDQGELNTEYQKSSSRKIHKPVHLRQDQHRTMTARYKGGRTSSLPSIYIPPWAGGEPLRAGPLDVACTRQIPRRPPIRP